MGSKVTLDQLVQRVSSKDPALFDLLRGMINEIKRLSKDIDVINQPDLPEELSGLFGEVPSIFGAELRSRSVHFYWTEAVGAIQYELRRGSSWSTAERLLITNTLTADIDPIAAGTTTFLLKAIDENGFYSVDPVSVDVVVHVPEGVTITTSIVDNNVLLYWNVPASDFVIDHYEIAKGGVAIGDSRSTFTSIFETQSGSYVYSVTAVDIADNVGVTNSVTATVKQPPDYELTDLFESTLTGTATDTAVFEGKLYAPCDTVSIQDHYDNNSYTTPQDQIDDGYPYYIQPTPNPGTYEETKDFGSLYTNVIVNLDWDYINIIGAVGITAEIEVSDDNIVWSAPVAGVSSFFESVRYVRVTLTFTPATPGEDFCEFFNFRVLLDVKREVDGGTIDALAADAAGTVVTFNKSFKDVESITVSALSTTLCTVIYDFVDAPNPTEFKVLVFDSAGVRIDKTISWKARGIV